MQTIIALLTTTLLLTSCNGSGHDQVGHEPHSDSIFHSDVFKTRTGYAELTADMPGTIGVFYCDSRKVTGAFDIRDNSFELHIYLKSLKTGIEQRDTQLHKSFNVVEHPFAEFSGKVISGIDLNSSLKQSVTLAGELTLNGVTRQQTTPGTLQIKDDGILLDAEWILDVSEFGITPPQFMTVRVSEKQEIHISVMMEPQLLATAR